MEIRKYCLIAIAALFILFLSGCITGNSSAAKAVQDSGSDNVLKIPVSEISAQAKWYEYDFQGFTIKFFAVQGSDGIIRTAFDACDVCGNKKKGYRQQGNAMLCNNCGKTFAIDSIGTENRTGGGCWPGYLPSKIIGNELVIEKADLEDGSYRFA